MDKEYNKVGSYYSKIIVTDPSKQFVQYPFILNELGDVSDKKILDIGCGDGILTKQIADRGAIVVGYDTSEKLINKAKESYSGDQIKYEVATPQTFNSDIKFDFAISNLVFPCAEDYLDLKGFFNSAFSHLKDNTSFISATLNPDFKRMGQKLYNRRFTHVGKDKIKVEFFKDDGSPTFSILDSFFSKDTYEKAAKESGFEKIEWKKMLIDPAGIDKMGEDFWSGYEEDCPYIGLVVNKK